MEDTLRHYGILGMKWGVRRARQDTTSSDHKRASEIKKKKLHEMSNEELKTLTTRLQLEKQYKDLNPSTISKGKKIAGMVLAEYGKEASKDYLKKNLPKYIGQAVPVGASLVFGLYNLYNAYKTLKK